MRKLLVITGPTASGKSCLAVEIAKELKSGVISCDSMQIYKDMDIGTAKITDDEMDGIPHYLLSYVDPTASYGVNYFVSDFERILKSKFVDKDAVPILCGGTGFYINALLFNYDFNSSDVDERLRAELTEIAEKEGSYKLHSILREMSPDSADRLSPNDVKRVVRAIEILKLTGKEPKPLNYDELKPKYDYCLIGLDVERKILYDRINSRVDAMMNCGLLDEVKSLIDRYGDALSFQAIGYKELADVLKDRMTLEEAVCLIKQRSRNYAKRQITFLKKIPGIIWLDNTQSSNLDCLKKQVLDLYYR